MLNRTKREEPPVAGTTGGSFVYYGVLISFFVDQIISHLIDIFKFV